MITIVELTADNASDLHKANQPFDVMGRLDLKFENGKWSCAEELFEAVNSKQYPNYDGAEAEDYISSADRIAYLAYEDGRCVGQVLLAKTWNGYAHVEDISVARAFRGRGIGRALLEKAEAWAMKNQLDALSLECQDNNLLASRFYRQNGFEIGGVNTRLYAMLAEPYASETAVFWYKNIQN